MRKRYIIGVVITTKVGIALMNLESKRIEDVKSLTKYESLKYIERISENHVVFVRAKIKKIANSNTKRDRKDYEDELKKLNIWYQFVNHSKYEKFWTIEDLKNYTSINKKVSLNTVEAVRIIRFINLHTLQLFKNPTNKVLSF